MSAVYKISLAVISPLRIAIIHNPLAVFSAQKENVTSRHKWGAFFPVKLI